MYNMLYNNYGGVDMILKAIRIDEEVFKKLKLLSVKEGISIGKLIGKLLEYYTTEKK